MCRGKELSKSLRLVGTYVVYVDGSLGNLKTSSSMSRILINREERHAKVE